MYVRCEGLNRETRAEITVQLIRRSLLLHEKLAAVRRRRRYIGRRRTMPVLHIVDVPDSMHHRRNQSAQAENGKQANGCELCAAIH